MSKGTMAESLKESMELMCKDYRYNKAKVEKVYFNNYKKSISLLYGVILIEILWEIFENTAFIINKYRRSRTLYRDYSGDSIANMVSDTLFTLLGVALVWNLPFRMILPTFILLEVLTYILINDTILINIYSLTVA